MIEFHLTASLSKRRLRIAVMAAAATFLGATTACSATNPMAERLDKRAVKVGQLERTYFQFVPSQCRQKAANCPLVFGFHGGGVKGVSGVQFNQQSGLSAAATARGFIVILPNARDMNWNDGRPEVGETADDIGFVKAIVENIKSDGLRYDAKRVFATGMSNGGHMSFRLACEMADIFSAVAPVAASLGVVTSAKCKPSGPISVLNIVGTEDPISPYGGGMMRFRNGPPRGEILSSDQTLAFWVKANDCANEPQISALDTDPDDQTSIAISRYGRCAGAAAVERRSVVGGGHIWPGEKQNRIVALFTGSETREIDATKAVLDFFGI
jgi:polyhydroxybutyrate depolymerase